jgi:hypothetical protein
MTLGLKSTPARTRRCGRRSVTRNAMRVSGVLIVNRSKQWRDLPGSPAVPVLRP